MPGTWPDTWRGEVPRPFWTGFYSLANGCCKRSLAGPRKITCDRHYSLANTNARDVDSRTTNGVPFSTDHHAQYQKDPCR
jgi:hypothetical protein